MHREPEVPEARVPVEDCFDCHARITSKELAPIHSVRKWHPPECLFYRSESGCRFGISALMRIARLKNSLANGLKRMVTKVQWLCCRKVHDNWVAYVRIWSRLSLHRFRGRAQTYRNQSDVFNSQKPSYVMRTFETKIHR